MSENVITKEDLQIFRLLLLADIQKIFQASKPEERPEWLKSGEVRKILNVSPNTLQNLRVSGKLNGKKINGSWYYSLSQLKEMFK